MMHDVKREPTSLLSHSKQFLNCPLGSQRRVSCQMRIFIWKTCLLSIILIIVMLASCIIILDIWSLWLIFLYRASRDECAIRTLFEYLYSTDKRHSKRSNQLNKNLYHLYDYELYHLKLFLQINHDYTLLLCMHLCTKRHTSINLKSWPTDKPSA